MVIAREIRGPSGGKLGTGATLRRGAGRGGQRHASQRSGSEGADNVSGPAGVEGWHCKGILGVTLLFVGASSPKEVKLACLLSLFSFP